MEQQKLPHYIVIFPIPFQGPMNSTMKLAELLSISGLHITFIITEFIHARLLQTTNIQSFSQRYPGFRFKTVPDGLPDDHSREGVKFMEVFDSLNLITKPIFRDMLVSGCLSSEIRGPVTCIIADGLLGFTCDVGRETGVPVFYFRTPSPCCLWTFFCLPNLIHSGEVPFPDDDMDAIVRNVPGTEGVLRRRDLPSFFRSADLDNQDIQLFLKESEEDARADGLILNTFDELDLSVLPHIRTICPNIYTIGPIHAHLKTKVSKTATSPAAFSSSLWPEDWSPLTWLDQQPVKSAIYVSFGSITVLNRAQLLEFWAGLVNSGVKFLWVMRPESIADDESEIPKELLKGAKEMGCIVDWAPQEEVLGHGAIGGFLTHSGWNSTLESICAGVPMICWPFFADQQVNSRFVSEVWKLGLDMKDSCDRNIVEKMVRELMVERKEEFSGRAAAMAEKANRCLSEGGSSYCNLERLIKDMDAMMPLKA